MFSEKSALAVYVADGATKESVDEVANLVMAFLVDHEADLHVHSAAVSVDLAQRALTIELCGLGTSEQAAWLAVTTAIERALSAATARLRDKEGAPMKTPKQTDLRVMQS